MEAYALKMTLGVDQKTAEGLIKGYLDGFPGLRDWRENSRRQIKDYAVVPIRRKVMKPHKQQYCLLCSS